jgi:hypothetical protein
MWLNTPRGSLEDDEERIVRARQAVKLQADEVFGKDTGCLTLLCSKSHELSPEIRRWMLLTSHSSCACRAG